MSHAIYIERNASGLHGLTVLFGAIRMYCKIASRTTSDEPSALLGVLDISTGEERFVQIDPQGLTEAPTVVTAQYRDRGVEMMMAELERQVLEAGAKGWSFTARPSVAHALARPVGELWRSSTSDTFSDFWSGTTLGQAQTPKPMKE